MTDFLQEFRNGNKVGMVISIALNDNRMTTDEIKEILTTKDYSATKIGYRRAMRHINAPAALTKKLSKNGDFMHNKCIVSSWEEATAEELNAGAKWMCENANSGYMASVYAKNKNAGEKTLKYLYRNCDNDGYLWEALLLNPNTPQDVRNDIKRRMSYWQMREINAKIEELKQEAREIREANKA